jgi:hypothetical protein
MSGARNSGYRARLMAALRAKWLADNRLFWAIFAVLALFSFATVVANPIGPGQDYNFHLFSASIAARGWAQDAAVTALYHQVNPTDCNTLLYVALFPFELLFGPVRGFSIGFGLFYFVGYPAACAAALAIMRRPLWGALLAFPLCWLRSYNYGGYMPFVFAVPWFVLALALFHRAMTDATEAGIVTPNARRRRRGMIAAALGCAAVFLAHAHASGWLLVILAAVTLWTMGQGLVISASFAPLAALRGATATGLRALVLVVPTLLLSGSWWFRRSYGEHAVAPTAARPSIGTWQQNFEYAFQSLFHINDDAEYMWVAALFMVVLAGLLFSARSRERLPTPEIAILATAASCFILPYEVNGQGLGARQIDLTQWLLPLIVIARVPERARGRYAVAVGAIIVFAFGRTAYFAKHMRSFQTEVAGMLDMAKPCPASTGELAYVTYGRRAARWRSDSLHQSHETLAALCKIDTPVYDTRVFPYSLQPVRYLGALPAPVTILADDNPAWYAHPGLWQNFDVVLVRNWNPTPEQLREAEALATRTRVSGAWQLWRRK